MLCQGPVSTRPSIGSPIDFDDCLIGSPIDFADCLIGSPIKTADCLIGPPISSQSTVRRILAAEYVLPPKLNLSETCKDLIGQIFTVDPHKRITMDGIKKHPWFTTPMSAVLEVCPQLCPRIEARLVAVSRRGGKLQRLLGSSIDPRALGFRALSEGTSLKSSWSLKP